MMDWRKILPGLIISAMALAIVFYLADIKRFFAALQLADYRFVILGLGISLLWLLIRSMVWRILLNERSSITQIFMTINEGFLLNYVLPLRMGEIGRTYLLAKKAKLDFWNVFSKVIIERSMDLAVAVVLILCTLPFILGAAWAYPAAFTAGGLVLLVFIVLYFLACRRDWTMDRFHQWAHRYPILEKLLGQALLNFLNGLSVLVQANQLGRVMLWIILNWCVALGQYYVYLSAFFPNPSLLWAGFGLGVVAMGLAIPSSPGALGVMELALVGALAVFGLDASISLAAAVTIHLGGYLIAGTLGSFALARDGESLWGLWKRARQVGIAGSGNSAK